MPNATDEAGAPAGVPPALQAACQPSELPPTLIGRTHSSKRNGYSHSGSRSSSRVYTVKPSTGLDSTKSFLILFNVVAFIEPASNSSFVDSGLLMGTILRFQSLSQTSQRREP